MGAVSLTVRYVTDLSRIDSPRYIAVDHEAAGTSKNVHFLQVAHEPHLPQQEVFGRKVGEALMTTNGTRLRAQRLIAPSHHVSVRFADADKFVKREDQARIGQNSPGQAEEIDAISVEMMKMNDIGPNGGKKFGKDLEVTG